MPDIPVPDPAASHITALRALAEQAVYRPGSLDPAVALPVLGEKFLRALDALDGVLKRHPPKTVTVQQRCPVHLGAFRAPPSEINACPDCTSRPQVTCAACDPICPDDNLWPCPTVRDVSRGLLGEGGSDG